MGFFSKEQVPPAPDMSGVINAAKEVQASSSGMAKEVYDWAQKAVSDNGATIGKFVDQLTSDSNTARGMIQQFQNLSNKQVGLADGAANIRDAAVQQAQKQGAVQDTQLGIQQKQLGEQDAQLQYQKQLQQIQQDFRGDQQAIQQKSQQLYDQYQKTYPAAMEKFAADAANYDTPERRAQAGAEAQAGVGMQFQAARDAATRQLESFGIKPSDTRFAALDLGTRIKEAATKAAADRQAQLQTEQQGFNLRQAAIAQGQALPGQSTAETNAATQAGSLVNAAGTTANQAGAVGAQYGSLANQAGSNANQAGANVTGALNSATGATQAGTGALTGATQAQTGALAANTGAAGITGAAGDLTNKTLATDVAAQQGAVPYVNAATSGVNAQTGAIGQSYKNQMDQFKAEQSNTSGLGALLGTVAGPLLKAGLAGATGGASLIPSIAGAATSGGTSDGGSISTGTPEYGPTPFPDTGSGGLNPTTYSAGGSGGNNDPMGINPTIGIAAPAQGVPITRMFAEGGAIPMSASPTQGEKTDDVKAMLNAGEFIVPKDVASWYGEKFFQNLIQKAQNEKSKATAKPAVGPMTPGPPTVASGPSAMQGAI